MLSLCISYSKSCLFLHWLSYELVFCKVVVRMLHLANDDHETIICAAIVSRTAVIALVRACYCKDPPER